MSLAAAYTFIMHRSQMAYLLRPILIMHKIPLHIRFNIPILELCLRYMDLYLKLTRLNKIRCFTLKLTFIIR